ncbi:MAG TPA: ABC transporter permease, partial [Bryobacteraceae bacterium]|nr:ABC transporter permease [Bryobacteraceae bacterium]
SGAKRGAPGNFSYTVFKALRDHNHVLSGTFALWTPAMNMRIGNGPSESVFTQWISPSYFPVLGVSPLIGRLIGPNDNREPVAVLSASFWRQRFGGDPNCIGKTITLSGVEFTIIGVTPPAFFGVEAGPAPAVSIPLGIEPRLRAKSWLPELNFSWLMIMGRLKPGVTLQQAEADLNVVYRLALEQSAASATQWRPRREYLDQRIAVTRASGGLAYWRYDYARPLLILMCVVAMLLLIGCANLANLLLARASARQREMAVRIAIGAGRWRIVRQSLTECLLLAIAGTAAGFCLAVWIAKAFPHFGFDLDVHPDSTVLLFTCAISLLTVVLCGLMPALRNAQVDLTPALKDNAGASRRTGNFVPSALTIAQVASSVVLVIGAALFTRTLMNLKSADLGFRSDDLILVRLDPPGTAKRLENAYRGMIDSVRRLPGIRNVTIAGVAPLTGGLPTLPVAVGPLDQPKEVAINVVGPDFFQTVGTAILAGRDFTDRDTPATPKVVVVNEALAKRLFPHESPIGRSIRVGEGKHPQIMQVAGVSANAKYAELRAPAPETMYIPYFQNPAGYYGGTTLEVLTAGNPATIIPAIRRAVQSVDKDFTIVNTATMAGHLNSAMQSERMMAALSSAFGFLALLLACVGLYGVMAYRVARRTNEIGIRMALGAQRGDVVRMVLHETLVLVAAGIVIGIPAALLLSRLTASLLYGIRPADPASIVAAIAIMLASAIAAAYFPARRASRINPMQALRCE